MKEFSFLLYTVDDSDIKVNAILKDETIWLSQKGMAELFDVEVPAISKHLTNIYAEGELSEDATVSKMEIVQQEGKRQVEYYSLDAIISVGYRVNSKRTTHFRIWATKVLKEHMIKGFALDDERLKQGKTTFGKESVMEQHNPVHAPIPGLGLRSLKTALAATLTALLYAFIPGSNPTFACIGAIFGMGADMTDSWRSGGNRFFGTIIGGFIGLGLFLLEHSLGLEGCYWLRLPLVFLGIIILVTLCVLFHWPGGVQPGGVVLCIILFNTPAHYINYAFYRMLDTGVGVLIALLVNYVFSRKRVESWFHLKDKKMET